MGPNFRLKQILEAPQIAQVSKVQSWTKQQYNSLVVLTSATNVAWDLDQSNAFSITLSHNVTLTAQNMKPGAYYSLVVRQDNIGGRTLVFAGGSFKWADSLPPTITLDPNAIDLFTFFYDGVDFLGAQMTKFG